MSIKQTASGNWQVKVLQKGRLVATKTFTSKNVGMWWDAEQKITLQNGTWTDPKNAKASPDQTVRVLAAQFDAFRADTIGEHTYETESTQMRLHVIPILGDRTIESVTEADILEFLVAVMKKTSRHTARRVRDTLVAFYMFVILRKGASSNIARAVSVPRGPSQKAQKPRPLTDGDLAAMLAEQTTLNERYALVVEFLAETGLRWGELCALTSAEIVMEPKPSVAVWKSKSDGFELKVTKSEQQRRVPLSDRAQEIVALVAAGNHANEPLFSAPRGGPLNAGNLKRAFSWTTTSRNHRIHDLRHTAGANWIRRGIHIDVVSLWLGHTSVRTTQDIYVDIISMVGEDESIVRMNTPLTSTSQPWTSI